MQINQENEEVNNNKVVETPQNGNEQNDVNDPTTTILFRNRRMDVFYEMSPELEDSHEEIRRLDSQLDHLNEYMDKVEERIKAHNDKLMETLKQQKEDREKRRQSFHERLEMGRSEDEDFQQQLHSVLNRVDSMRH
ncbi:hypothetical protein Mgra_00009030 [Meloidogyne graminicola]|uniref:Uncharacterized protein n=1 Tax=Meloidogyne graminicola TaxID=189291 RepID=A0A8S9ZE20_9BILA|nr:hypothetical protein Mgra_00009030 [Meloidogyne graminicola]